MTKFTCEFEPSGVKRAPCLPEAFWFELHCDWLCLQHGVVAFLGFCWRNVADGLQEPVVIEPVDPFQGGVLAPSTL